MFVVIKILLAVAALVTLVILCIAMYIDYSCKKIKKELKEDGYYD